MPRKRKDEQPELDLSETLTCPEAETVSRYLGAVWGLFPPTWGHVCDSVDSTRDCIGAEARFWSERFALTQSRWNYWPSLVNLLGVLLMLRLRPTYENLPTIVITQDWPDVSKDPLSHAILLAKAISFATTWTLPEVFSETEDLDGTLKALTGDDKPETPMVITELSSETSKGSGPVAEALIRTNKQRLTFACRYDPLRSGPLANNSVSINLHLSNMDLEENAAETTFAKDPTEFRCSVDRLAMYACARWLVLGQPMYDGRVIPGYEEDLALAGSILKAAEADEYFLKNLPRYPMTFPTLKRWTNLQ